MARIDMLWRDILCVSSRRFDFCLKVRTFIVEMFVNFLHLRNLDFVCLPHTLLLSSGSLLLGFGDSPSFGLAGLELAFA